MNLQRFRNLYKYFELKQQSQLLQKHARKLQHADIEIINSVDKIHLLF